MNDQDEVVGHKTFRTGDPLNPFRHEPLTRQEADALWKRAQAMKAERAAKYPTEQDCVNALWEACQRLEELGWKRARLSPRDRKIRKTISLGTTGIHDAFCELRPQARIGDSAWWWHQSEDGDMWPHEPIYFKPDEEKP